MSKVTKKDVQNIAKINTGNPVAIKPEDALDPAIMAELEAKMPPWIKELEADGTSVLRWMQEFLILQQEILKRDFNFSEEDTVRLEERTKEMLPHLHKMALEGLTILNHENMRVAMDIVEIYKQQIKQKESKLILPKGVKRIRS